MIRTARIGFISGIVVLALAALGCAGLSSGVAAPGNPGRLLFIRVAFSPDGQTLAFSGFEGTVSRTGGKISFEVGLEGAHGMGTISANVDGAASKRRMLAGGMPGNVTFSPDGMFVWEQSDDQLIRVALADRKNARAVVADVADCVFSGDGRWALVRRGKAGGYVVVDVESALVGNPLADVDGKEERTLGIDEQGIPLMTYVRGERLVIFDLAKHAEVGGIAWPASRERVASGTVAKGILVVGAEKGGLFAWSLVDKKQIQMPVMTAGSEEIRAVSVAPEGDLVAYGADNGTVGIVDLGRGGVTMSLGAHAAPVKGIAFSRDGTKVATAALDEIRVWKVSRPQACPNGSCPPGTIDNPRWTSPKQPGP